MKNKTIFSLALLSLIFLTAGCTKNYQTTSGVVGYEQKETVGMTAPDIPFVSSDGKQESFSQIRQPIAIEAFVEAPGTACCRLLPDLVQLSNRFSNDEITVAQISLPTSQCPHGKGCTEVCNLNNARLVSLCDKDRIAWNEYDQPKNNTVFLINSDGRIAAISDIKHLQSIAQKASNLESQYEQVQKIEHEGD